MSRCKEFYDKWECQPNWCEKCADSVKNISSYIDLVKDLEARSISKETTNVGLSEGAARPLMREKDPIIKEKAIESVKKSLESKKNPSNGKFTKKLTSGDVKTIINKISNNLTPEMKELVKEADLSKKEGSLACCTHGNRPRVLPLRVMTVSRTQAGSLANLTMEDSIRWNEVSL